MEKKSEKSFLSLQKFFLIALSFSLIIGGCFFMPERAYAESAVQGKGTKKIQDKQAKPKEKNPGDQNASKNPSLDLEKELKEILNDKQIREKIAQGGEGILLLYEKLIELLLEEMRHGLDGVKKNKEAYLIELKEKLDSLKEAIKREVEKPRKKE